MYSLIRVADATGEELLLDAALKLAKQSNLRIKQDELDEIFYGRGGYLLALIALYKRCSDSKLFTIMNEVANQLIQRLVATEKGNCWRVLNKFSLPNMSHGTSGIAMALARWAELANDEVIKNKIVSVLDYDNSFWDEGESGWIDARVLHTNPEYKTTWTWCNGRSGALLSRLAIAKSLNLPFEDAYIVKAVAESRYFCESLFWASQPKPPQGWSMDNGKSSRAL